MSGAYPDFHRSIARCEVRCPDSTAEANRGQFQSAVADSASVRSSRLAAIVLPVRQVVGHAGTHARRYSCRYPSRSPSASAVSLEKLSLGGAASSLTIASTQGW